MTTFSAMTITRYLCLRGHWDRQGSLAEMPDNTEDTPLDLNFRQLTLIHILNKGFLLLIWNSNFTGLPVFVCLCSKSGTLPQGKVTYRGRFPCEVQSEEAWAGVGRGGEEEGTWAQERKFPHPKWSPNRCVLVKVAKLRLRFRLGSASKGAGRGYFL